MLVVAQDGRIFDGVVIDHGGCGFNRCEEPPHRLRVCVDHFLAEGDDAEAIPGVASHQAIRLLPENSK
jgi:hypothetical protein